MEIVIDKTNKQLCEELRATGLSYAKIAKKLNLSITTVQYHLNENIRIATRERANRCYINNKEKYDLNHKKYMASKKGQYAIAKCWLKKYLRDGNFTVDDVLKIVEAYKKELKE